MLLVINIANCQEIFLVKLLSGLSSVNKLK
jgi:hypothetical protein